VDALQRARKLGIKVVLSIGSANDDSMSSDSFMRVASDETLRAKFARQIVVILKKYDLDGVFLKWIYPGCPMV